MIPSLRGCVERYSSKSTAPDDDGWSFGLVRRLRTAIASPETVVGVARMTATKAGWLLRRRRAGALAGFLVESVVGWNPYYEWRRRRNDGGYLAADLGEYRLLVDPADTGISRTLLSYGTHEHCSAMAFAAELRRLEADVDGDITVLEVGANIGYYALLEASVLGERARIHAIEPAPDNLALLERNVRQNGYEDVIEVDQLAVGERVEPVRLHLDSSSNKHGVRPENAPADDATGHVVRGAGTMVNAERSSHDALTVQQTTVDEYLDEHGIAPSAVNVVRMDVEGYEAEIFAGMESVLAADTPLVVYLEFHQNYLHEAAARGVVEALAENGFEIVSAVSERDVSMREMPRWYGHQLDIETFADLLAEDHYVELIVRR